MVAPLLMSAMYKPIPITLDMSNIPQLPKRFRTVADKQNQSSINWYGFENLNIAGGGQFSSASFKKIMQVLHTSQIIIFDLRQESHGFINGHAISWYGVQAGENAGKTNQEITADEAFRLKTLAMQFPANHVCSEQEFIRAQHNELKYYRLYIQNYHAPNDHEVNRFVLLARQLHKQYPKAWIYFHCRAGIGRTSTFMVMYDMLQNAKYVSFDDILARQAAIGGKNLAILPDKTSFKYQWAKARLEFLQAFYQYARRD